MGTFSADKPLSTWQQRLASYPEGSNTLLDIVNAYHELELIGKEQHRQVSPKTGLPNFTEAELEKIVGDLDESKSALKREWKRQNPTIRHYQDRALNTGYDGARAFKGIVPYAPISLLVCPTKPCYTFEQYIEETPSEQIGQFFKSVLHTARQATNEYDAKVAADPVLKAKRDYYENAFSEIRQGLHAGKSVQDYPNHKELINSYIKDSRELGFSVRDARTGRGGFRIAINTSPGEGMSQPHFHVHVLGGRYLGAPLAPLFSHDEKRAMTGKPPSLVI